MTSLSPSLAALREELDANTARLHALVDTMDDATWRTRPGSGRWSVAECAEHLNITSHAYVPLVRDAIHAGRERGLTNPGGSNRLDIMGWLLVKSLEPPVKERRRMKTGPAFVPASIEARPKVVSEFDDLQKMMIGFLTDAEGLALSKIKVRSAFNSKLRYGVYSAYRILAVHQRRHLWQAEEARKAVRAAAR